MTGCLLFTERIMNIDSCYHLIKDVRRVKNVVLRYTLGLLLF